MIDPRKIWSSPLLPTLPSVAIRLLELSKDPEVEIEDVINTIKTDPAISAKILKSTNSSFFGVSYEVTSIDRAVPLLGTTMVTSLALSFSLSEAAMSSGPLAEHYRSYWIQSVVQGVAAETLGKTAGGGLECEYFLAGLLMDLGRLAMLKTISGEYLLALNAANNQQRPLYEVETDILAINHIEIGMRLMLNWNLPGLLIDGVRYHHASREQLKVHADSEHFHLRSTMAAAASVGDYFCTENKGHALFRLRQIMSDFFSMTEPEIQVFLGNVKTKIDTSQEIFAVDASALPSPTDLMGQANEQLVQLALREHVASTKAMAMHRVAEQEKQILASKHEELQEQSVHDSLTKTYNRQFFEESLKREINCCSQSAATLGLLFCDIDHFKKLNDTYGHQFGDHVLQKVVEAFKRTLRGSDILSRFGGEEFVILISQPTEIGISRIAERLRQAIEEEDVTLDGKRIPVTVSIGAVLSIPEREHKDLETSLIALADEAMYEAKRNGRNQIHVESLLTDLDRQLLTESNRMRFSRWIVGRNILDVPTVSKALLQCEPPKLTIGEIAKQKGILTENQIQDILQNQDDQRFGQTAIRMGILTALQLAGILALQREEPDTLVKVLIRLGMLEQDSMNVLLQEYLAELDAFLKTNATTAPLSSPNHT